MTNTEARQAVLEEVRLTVVEAKRDGDAVRADMIAKIVASSYPGSGLTSWEIAERIKDAAAAIGVPVDLRGGGARAQSMWPATQSIGTFDRRFDASSAGK